MRRLLRRHLRPELYLVSSQPPLKGSTICNQSSHAPAKYLILASLNDGLKLWVILSGRQVSQQCLFIPNCFFFFLNLYFTDLAVASNIFSAWNGLPCVCLHS